MCGIATILSNKKISDCEKEYFKKIIEESSVRGLHSFGISHVKNNELVTKKFYEILECIDYFKKNVDGAFIYHNRYSTSGDWKNENNNQPLTDGKNAIVFNGVISMKTKEQMEAEYSIELKNDNDGEIFLNKLENPLKFLTQKKEEISIAALYIKNNKVYAIRNSKRPLWYAEKFNSIFIASTKDILKRSGFSKINCTDVYKIYDYDKLKKKKTRIHRLSYSNDEQWGYRPSEQLPALHSKQI